MTHIVKAVFCAAALTLSACSSEPLPAAQKIADQASGTVEVSSAVIKPPMSGRTTAAAFMTLENKGPATRLVAASSPISPLIEIHTHIDDNGIMRMRKIEGIDLPTGETVTLQSGGYHLMLFSTTLSEDQTDAELTLRYDNGQSVTMIVPIGAR